MYNAGGEGLGLARAGPGQYQNRAGERGCGCLIDRQASEYVTGR